MTGRKERDRRTEFRKTSACVRWGDLVVAAVVLIVAVVLGALVFWPRQAGQSAVLQTPAGEQRLPLSEDARYEAAGNEGMVLTIEVADGRVRVLSSDCPDQVCVHTGWLSRDGDTAACVPAGVSVRVEGGEESPVDAVAR